MSDAKIVILLSVIYVVCTLAPWVPDIVRRLR